MLGRRPWFALLLVPLLIAAGCRRSAPEGPLVARGDGLAISAAELQAKLDEQPPVIRARYDSPERKKEFLENVIRFRLLVAEARKRKLDEDPEIREALERLMVQKLTRQTFDEKPAAADDGDVRAYFEEHSAEFQQPERLRISVISLRVKSPDERAQRAAEARRLYARLKAEEPKNPLAFSNVARDASDDAGSKMAGGDLGFRTREELQRSWPAAVVTAAFALQDDGQDSPLVEAPEGFFVVRRSGRQAGVTRSLEEARPQIAARLSREQRAKAFDEFVGGLRSRAGIKIDEAELAKVSTAAPPAAAGAKKP